jgi:hypothetical protein
MRSILTKIFVAAALLTGGVASADTFQQTDARDHRTPSTEVAQRDRGDYDRAPAAKFERHRQRRGYVWVGGQWTKQHHRWVWQPGHFERIRK